MKGPGRKYRLSPNEEARIIREEKERRRKLRLVQVREQAKINAAKVREAVKQERENQLSLLAAEIKDEWEEEKAEKVRKLQEIHLRSLRHVGDAHVNATQQEPTDIERALIGQQNLQKAAQRHLEALRKMKEEKAKKDEEANRHIVNRQFAITQEKERAAEIASLPTPDPDPVQDITIPKMKPIKLTDVNAFSLTHYHMPMEEYAVERAQPAEQADAKKAATEEQERIESLEEEQRVAAHEREEKARLRHKHARQKELLSRDYDAMLHDLSDLRRTDIARRQQVVAKIPRAVYQAPHRRLEEKEEAQREMEAAFEDMYMATTENKGDLTLALDKHPPPAVTPAGSSALDLTVDRSDLEAPQEAQRGLPLKDLTNLSAKSLQQKVADSKANESALGRLMSKIQAQRDNCSHRPEPAPTPTEMPRQQTTFVPVQRDQSTTSGGSLTQHTLSSGTTGSVSVTTLDESSTDVSSVTTVTSSKVSSVPTSQRSVSSATITDTDVTTTTEETLEEGTISSSATTQSATLHTDMTGSDTLLHPMEIAAKVRQKPLDDTSAPIASFLDQHKLTKQPNLEQLVSDFRQEQQRLEHERRKLEKKIKDLEEKPSMKITPFELAQKYLHELPPLPKDEQLKTYTDLIQPTQENSERHADVSTDMSALSQPYGTSSAASLADKVQLYKQRALERYKERQRTRDSSTLGRSMDGVSSVKSLSPDRSHGSQGLFSGLSLSGIGAVTDSSAVTSPPGYTSLKQPGGSPYSGKSGDTNLSGMSYHSQEFDSRQAALKAQLAEIGNQKAELLALQQRHQNDMHQTKERWQRELEQYSLSDTMAGQRSMSLLTAPEATDEVPSGQGQNEPDEAEHMFDEEDNIDEDLLHHLNNLPLRATDHKYKIQRRKPSSRAIKVPNKSPMVPHELSTIQELDTPSTNKKTRAENMNSTKLNNDKTRQKPIARSLLSEMQQLQNITGSFSSQEPANNQTVRSVDLETPKTPQQLSQHFTKDPSEADALSGGRSDDLNEEYDPNWNVMSWVGLQSKTIERPMPSIDRVEEIHRLPKETPGELVLTPPAPTQDFRDYQADSTAFSSRLPTGPRAEESDFHPDSGGIVIPGGKHKDEVTPKPHNDKPVILQSYLKEPKEPETPPPSAPPPIPWTPTSPKTPTGSSPQSGFTSHYLPLKGQEKSKDWKKELAQYNQSYLTPPKMSPARPTDKILRCITTRAFGCERPIKGTAKSKKEMEEKHRANLMPPREVNQIQINRELGPDETLTPSRIRQMFEKSSQDPMASPIPKDKRSQRFLGQGQFLSSTPSSDKISSRLISEEGASEASGMPSEINNLQTPLNIIGSIERIPSEISEISARTSDRFSQKETVTPSEKSIQSEASQYRLVSDAETTKTPANQTLVPDASLSQGLLSATSSNRSNASLSQESLSVTSGNRTETNLSLGQYRLEDSHGTSAAGSSPFRSIPRTSTFQPLMEMSRSSDGSAKTNLMSPLLGAVSEDPERAGMFGTLVETTGYMAPSRPESSTGPSQNVVDLAMDISKRAEAAMEKYDRLMEESKRLREQYEVEEQVLMEETASRSQTRDPPVLAWGQDLDKSIERIIQEETGISDEPDITLVSASSTPQKPALVTEPPPNRDLFAGSQSDNKSTSQPGSLTSFERHEESLATMSQVSLIRQSLSDEKNPMSASQSRSVDMEPLTPYGSSSSTNGSSMAASGAKNDLIVSATEESKVTTKGASGGRISTVKENQNHMSRTLASWKKKNSLQAQSSKPSASSDVQSLSLTTKTTADQKKKEREMKERTERLYSQLEDVKHHRQEKQREEEYAANRQRKLEYQKNYQEQLRKKMQIKKS